MYYKGTVTHVRQQMPSGGINLMGRGDYDPWEALEVEWDVGGDAEGMDHVSPWEIEVFSCFTHIPSWVQECQVCPFAVNCMLACCFECFWFEAAFVTLHSTEHGQTNPK